MGWFKENHLPIRIIIPKCRRSGVSTGCESLIYHDTTHYPRTNSLIVANQSQPSENVLKMCTTFWKNTPTAPINFQPKLPASYRNNPPRDRLEFEELESFMFVATARSIDQYLSFGFQNIHATEVSYYKDGVDLFRALYPTLSTDPHSMLFMESTPNGQTGRGAFFFEQCMDAHNSRGTPGEYGVTRLLFIPWHEMKMSFRTHFESEKKKAAFAAQLRPEERDAIKQYDCDLEQLFWRRRMLAGPPFNNDPELFDQEYPSDLATAFLSTGTSVFGRKQIKRLMSRVRPPLWEGDIYWGDSTEKNLHEAPGDVVRRSRLLTRGDAIASQFRSHVNERTYKNFKVYSWAQKGDVLVVTADVGGGDPDTRNGDFSTIQVLRLNAYEQDEQIMVWKGHLNPLLFGEVISALCWYLYHQVGSDVTAPLQAVEWNGPGVPCNQYIDQKRLYFHTYRYVAPGVHGQPKSKHIGWESNAKTKPMMVEFTRRMIDQDLLDVPDYDTVIEMASYKKIDDYGDSSSFGGSSGRHDDLVSSLEIGAVLLRTLAGTGANVPAINISNDSEDEDDVPFSPFGNTDPGDFFAPDDGEEDDELTWYQRA